MEPNAIKTLMELVELAKSFEKQARKVSEMSEAFAQKYKSRLADRFNINES